MFADLGGESHLVADGADFLARFFGDVFGDGACGEAARLGVADEAHLSQAQIEAHLGIWVVLPEPVSPAMMTTVLRESRSRCLRIATGSSSGR